MKRNAPTSATAAVRSKPRTKATSAATAAESEFPNTTSTKSARRLQVYCPTDETDLNTDQQQVSLLDPREPRTQEAAKSSSKGTFTFAVNMIGGNKNGNGDQSHSLQQQQAKKATGQKNKNILVGAGGELTDDIESNSKARARSRSFKWIFIPLMAILFVSILVVIALFSFTSLLSPEEGDLCLSKNQPFQPPGYRLFSTKTLYTIALNHLSLVPPRAVSFSSSITPPSQISSQAGPTAASLVSINPVGSSNSNSNSNYQIMNLNQVYNYERSSIYRPKFFSPNETLESLHKRLTDVGCEARQFHLFGRHAARLPNKQQLERLQQNFKSIKKRIDLTLSQSRQTSNQKQVDVTPEGRPETAERSSAANSSETICSDPLVQFSDWHMFAEPKQGNLITETGAMEAQGIAKRFKELYPHLFNNMTSEISLGVTNEIRTAQTAVNFLKQVTDLNHDALKICELSMFPNDETDNPGQADNISQDKCYKSLIATYINSNLSFHDRCSSVNDQKRFKLEPSNYTGWITESVSRKLRIGREEDQLTHEETKSLYDLCKYETAIFGTDSIWCGLFSEEQLKLLEYLSDVDDFFGSAYGNPSQAHSACAVTDSLLRHYEKILLTGKSPANKAQFYFTHSEVIQKLIAASINLSRDPAYSPANIENYLKSRKVPKEREWQTSLLTPFSANMAFTLYECPISAGAKREKSEETITPSPDYKWMINLGGKSGLLKVVASLNEQPIMLDDCDGYACNLNTLYVHSRLARDKTCSMEEICG